jgi:HAD superfamily hydrolase (TIGR01549 family)
LEVYKKILIGLQSALFKIIIPLLEHEIHGKLFYALLFMNVIFDLDNTLVNTDPAAKELQKGNWEAAQKLIPKYKLFVGIDELLSFLNKNNYKIAIVSTSPRHYCEQVLAQFNISCNCIVGKEDAKKKPSASPILEALEILSIEKNEAIAIGDKARDIESSKKAGIISIGALWGSHEAEKLKKAKPEFLVSHPWEIISVLNNLSRTSLDVNPIAAQGNIRL